jgi:hypothetical protein
MKLLHKKILDGESINEHPDNLLKKTSKTNYFLNQFMIWILIISILLFIINFLNINAYLNP